MGTMNHTSEMVRRTVHRALVLRVRSGFNRAVWECAVEAACTVCPAGSLTKLHLLSRLVRRRIQNAGQQLARPQWGLRY